MSLTSSERWSRRRSDGLQRRTADTVAGLRCHSTVENGKEGWWGGWCRYGTGMVPYLKKGSDG
ncbi:hypothetical protein LC1Hm_3041 [Halomicrobium sp. LC1Hm]|nr:hypothetical protein LC1Hm_3041 [Halomicrobium sp. LC1Hm]